jgi:hypothetical protein
MAEKKGEKRTYLARFPVCFPSEGGQRSKDGGVPVVS